MLINNLEKLEKHLKIISGLATSERSFSDKRLKLLQEFYSDLKTLKSNFEARSLSLYIRSILKIPFIDKYPKNAHAFLVFTNRTLIFSHCLIKTSLIVVISG